MYSVFRTTRFKKDYKKLSKTNKLLLKDVVKQLAKNEPLDEKYKDHKLVGNYLGCIECHVKPDVLLIYRVLQDILELALLRVASHSELFKK